MNKDKPFDYAILIGFMCCFVLGFVILPLHAMQKFEAQDKAEQAWKEEAPYQAVLFDDNRTLDSAKNCKTKEETKICTFYNGEEEIEMVVRDYWKTDTGGKE